MTFHMLTYISYSPDRIKTPNSLRSSYILEGPARIGIECAYGQVYTVRYVHKGIQLKAKLEDSGTWSAAKRPSRCVCYRPAVFFRHLRLVGAIPARGVSKMSFSSTFSFRKNCVFRGSVCSTELCIPGFINVGIDQRDTLRPSLYAVIKQMDIYF
jgi:hypothetical protein